MKIELDLRVCERVILGIIGLCLAGIAGQVVSY